MPQSTASESAVAAAAAADRSRAHGPGPQGGGHRPASRPMPSLERQPPNASVNSSVVAVSLLFAAMGRAGGQDCAHADLRYSSPRLWMDKVCSEVESHSGGAVNAVVQREVIELERKLLETLARWNPQTFLNKTAMLGHHDFLQQQKCFSIQQLASTAAQKLHRITADSCRRDLRGFIIRLSSNIITHLLQGQQHGSTHAVCQLDFVTHVFNSYGVETTDCSDRHLISVDGLQTMLDEVRSKNCSQRSGHGHTLSTEPELPSRNEWLHAWPHDWRDSHQKLHNLARSRRTARLLANRRFSARQLVDLAMNNLTDTVTVQQFYQLCPALLQQMLMTSEAGVGAQDVEVEDPEMDGMDDSMPASAMQTYGLGTAAVTVITLCSLLGAVLVRLGRGVGRHYAMAAMLGLAVGNLCGDAILHLLPEALTVGHHNGHGVQDADVSQLNDVTGIYRLSGGFVIDDVRLKCLALLASIYAFWVLEILSSKYSDQIHDASKTSTYVKQVSERSDNRPSIPMSSLREMTEVTLPGQQPRDSQGHYEVVSPQCLQNKPAVLTPVAEFQESSRHLVWMIVVGDAVHNLADGLAIGAAFAHSVPLGLSTSLAVVCHEIPHELGDFAVLMSTGMKMRKALMLNFLSALTAFVGLYVGLAAGAHASQRQWIFVVVAGMFLYVSMADLIPELVRYFRHFRKIQMFVVQSIGLFSGFALMFVLVLVEEKLHF